MRHILIRAAAIALAATVMFAIPASSYCQGASGSSHHGSKIHSGSKSAKSGVKKHKAKSGVKKHKGKSSKAAH